MHPSKAEVPIVVTLSGIITEVSLLQPLNAYCGMVVILLLRVRDVIAEQYSKAYCPILVTLLGISTLVTFLQLLKAYSPIVLTLVPIVREVIAPQY